MKKITEQKPPTARKFTKWDVPPLATLVDKELYQLAQKWEHAPDRLTRQQKNKIAQYLRFGNNRLGGYVFSFPALPSFYVEQYGSTYIFHAPDKTAVRSQLHGKIDRINDRK